MKTIGGAKACAPDGRTGAIPVRKDADLVRLRRERIDVCSPAPSFEAVLVAAGLATSSARRPGCGWQSGRPTAPYAPSAAAARSSSSSTPPAPRPGGLVGSARWRLSTPSAMIATFQ